MLEKNACQAVTLRAQRGTTPWVELSGGPATVYNSISYVVGAEKQIILSSDEVDVPTVKVDLDRGSGIKDHRHEEINRGWIAMYRHDGS